MAFVFSLATGIDVDLDVLSQNNEWLARFPIGYEDETDFTYSGLVIFSPMPGGITELVFVIVSSDDIGQETNSYFDGHQTKLLIESKDTRQIILSGFCAAIERLIDECQPRVISMTTHTAALPQKALVKFNRIASLFRHRGYAAGRADSWNGRFIWMMELK